MSFQSSRPVAGARIDEPRRARERPLVSILAPRCRGAHPYTPPEDAAVDLFQSSRPVAGARICFTVLKNFIPSKFQSSRPVAGARIWLPFLLFRKAQQFQSSRPVAGARIEGGSRGISPLGFVSILAPRCRGAHPAYSYRQYLQYLFQSSRPVAGARINENVRQTYKQRSFNPRAPLPGRASPLGL